MTGPAGAVRAGLAIAGLAPLSTCDWPGHLVATVFLQGCPWRCTYCHNPDLLDPRRPGSVAWEDVLRLLSRRRGLLDGLVFSGGEATRQPALVEAARQVRDRGFGVGLHTAGAYPRLLRAVLPYVDWVGLDIKALPRNYREITGIEGSAVKAWAALVAVQDSGVPHEVRITVDPVVHTTEHVRELVRRLQELGEGDLVLQEMRSPGRPARAPRPPVLDAPPAGVRVRLLDGGPARGEGPATAVLP